ncbi:MULTISPECIES: MarR family winged helix-turn-helix transcriptional regulator [Vibrio]|jgi:DNA-binding MarR family transcriptional regulator|uniref:MarR family transcriptional regulator n=1 Tax=Vibrio splendidus TaxID=29497 RepID=A0A1B9QMZ0_VIBSP|nr:MULTISPECIES: MarR family transcriptional regulator [Vibrio]EAP94788.1 transcriptional regulator, MarR family [Vibrio splendidus 12B01]MBO7912914.1 MarR family transcriptional regulator [Vibrio sp. G41H]MBT9240778.1 MarR family transcriptional regulator [Vibrio splendidus]MCF7490735.1 MarR family transcriptional regulator [Vibrio sp. G-C-1]MCQ8868910.1 MarR family transcriptional regulator [Vibrio splendidus]
MLDQNLEKIERFASKIWRTQVNEDPICQLSFNEYDYLKVIQASLEPIRLTDLAIEMQVTKPSATTMVQRLERKGLVERKASLEDARSKLVILTQKAEVGLEEESKIYQVMAQILESRLSEQESHQLNLLLNKALK